MKIENDNVLNELFEEEFEKIPFLFRFSRKRIIIMLSIMCALIISTIVLIVLFYRSGNYELSSTLPGFIYQKSIRVYDKRLGIGLFISGAALVITILMMLAGKWFEERAFKKASILANKISIAEREAENNRWLKGRAESHF